MGRFIALMILVIPGIIAGYGIKLMRDTIFALINSPYPNLSVQFLVGFIFFIAGLGFIGGFIFHRDKKNGKIAPRFKNK
ncbi:DUF2627 domain-containing protein [Bacillus sp. FJAT-45037]|uniref:DUF2627 domain-containing protein n=1 Tax=Bacillus sp. FJAT-45037 TaxID=2011007 RepID=UPI000C24B43A|nr:DUF2627 domain-containing protein [Bacillus sp. FJAT-45037]